MAQQLHRAAPLPNARRGWSKEPFIAALLRSIAGSERRETPYRHWVLRGCLPEEAVAPIQELPFPAPSLGGLSGRRELHNATRKYFDPESRMRFSVCESFCQALQDERVTAKIAAHFETRLAHTFLRVEYAQDTDGFWLEPHTDLGVKAFTMLLYMSSHPQHATLGTDLYNVDKAHAARSPFAPNAALVFVPSDITYHGFEPRRIEGVRTSVIINYVTTEWRAWEQLAFPDTPVMTGAEPSNGPARLSSACGRKSGRRH